MPSKKPYPTDQIYRAIMSGLYARVYHVADRARSMPVKRIGCGCIFTVKFAGSAIEDAAVQCPKCKSSKTVPHPRWDPNLDITKL